MSQSVTNNFFRGGCLHGRCLDDGIVTPFCACHSGWRGVNCEKCQPYWACPNQEDDACNQPNECFCDSSFNDPLCNNTSLFKAKKIFIGRK